MKDKLSNLKFVNFVRLFCIIFIILLILYYVLNSGKVFDYVYIFIINLLKYITERFIIPFKVSIFVILVTVIPILLMVAFLTLLERKILAGVQRRRGPNLVGILGILQPFADGLKLILKETIIPVSSNMFMFIIAPIFTLGLSLLNWGVIPFYKGIIIADIDLSLLYNFALSSLGVYGFLMADDLVILNMRF